MRSRWTNRWAAACALAAILAGCGSGNKLAGTWQLVPEGDCAVDRLTFTAGNVLSRYGPSSPYAGQESTVPVTYLVDGDRVTATTRDRATSVTYVFADDDHMAMGDRPDCAFERTS